MDKYAALLHDRWEADETDDELINARWAEDHQKFYIQCPAQLRDLLVELQNALADRYIEIVAARTKLVELERQAARLLGA
jgi:hypothetical protein